MNFKEAQKLSVGKILLNAIFRGDVDAFKTIAHHWKSTSPDKKVAELGDEYKVLRCHKGNLSMNAERALGGTTFLKIAMGNGYTLFGDGTWFKGSADSTPPSAPIRAKLFAQAIRQVRS